nr:unnamed protein product [Callosobruchus analis]
MLDGTYEEDRRRGGSRGVFRPPQVRNSSNINSTSRDEGQNRGNTREIRYLTAFNAEPEALLSDPEEEVVEENFRSLVFRGIVGEEFTDILIDSGSQISAVSHDFVNQLRDKGVPIPSLPILDVSVSVAVGGKKYRVGDAVLVRQHPISSAMDASIKKFFLLHEGPYWVSKVVAPNCYQVIDKDAVVIGRHNIKNLKKFVSFNGIS